MIRFGTPALMCALWLLLGACGGESDAPVAVPEIINMGSLAVDAPVTPGVTVTDPDSHAYTFLSGPASQHTVTVIPTSNSQDPDVFVYEGDWTVSIPDLVLVGWSTNSAGVTDSVVFTPAATATYTVEVVNASASLTSASYQVRVTEP
jgi:hypothetical protein